MADTGKRLINFKIDRELHSWVKKFAAENGTDVTKLLVSHILELRNREDGLDYFMDEFRREENCKFVVTKMEGQTFVEKVQEPQAEIA
jgi:hypothetical protein